jgi:hypothetical protein
MNKKINLMHRCIVSLVVTTSVITAMIASGKNQIVLGPPESGTWSGSSKWLTGAYGDASTFFDFNDPSKGVCAFVLSNTVAGDKNKADWRCEPFPLGPAADGASPLTFSFAYKLPERVAARNNLHVQLRFFDAAGTNFFGERVILVGDHTSDSAMTDYRTLTINGILAPRKARTADIWINANIFEPWVSGAARFDDFSVTTEPRSIFTSPIALVGLAILMVIAVSSVLLMRRTRKRTA